MTVNNSALALSLIIDELIYRRDGYHAGRSRSSDFGNAAKVIQCLTEWAADWLIEAHGDSDIQQLIGDVSDKIREATPDERQKAIFGDAIA